MRIVFPVTLSKVPIPLDRKEFLLHFLVSGTRRNQNQGSLMTETFPQPYFDLEFFLNTLGEARLSGNDMDECLALWDQWSASLFRRVVDDAERRYFAVWLGAPVENTVDAAWEQAPSRGFRLNVLAQTLCMCAVHEQIPEVEEAGCAPVPYPSAGLVRALSDAGLPARSGAGLELGRRYAVVTRHPFGGGCEVCALLASCPRSGQGGDTVIEIG